MTKSRLPRPPSQRRIRYERAGLYYPAATPVFPQNWCQQPAAPEPGRRPPSLCGTSDAHVSPPETPLHVFPGLKPIPIPDHQCSNDCPDCRVSWLKAPSRLGAPRADRE